MKASQGRVLQSYQRVLSFLGANTALLGTIPQSTMTATLTSTVAAILATVSSQGAMNDTKKGLTNQVKSLRTALIGAMRPVAAIVKDTVADIPQLPALKPPAANVSSGVLVGLANSMVQAATPYEQTFISAGLSTTFLTDLAAAGAALGTAITAQGTTKAQRVSATAAVTAAFQQARRTMEIINPLVETALAGNTAMLKEWDNVKRITLKGTSAVIATPVVAEPTPAAPKPAAPKPAAPAPTTEVKAA